MIGAYGLRWANYLVDYSDCILTLGSRLDCRQTGVDKSLFATQAKILRVDIDPGELDNRIGKREIQFVISLQELLPALVKQAEGFDWDFTSWSARGCTLREKIQALESKNPGNLAVEKISQLLPDHITITTDVGQNQVWIAQSLHVKAGQRVLFSGGHGAMGYSLPAAIGAAVATKRPVVCFVGDGGLQMNLQELQFVVREKLPIKIILLNNRSLGMIHHFQEMYFNGNYVQTDDKKGFTVPDFCGIARAYGLRVISSTSDAQLASILRDDLPAFLELELPQTTHVFPKLGMNSPLHEQEPPLSEEQAHEMKRICLGYEEN
jgi:acetolactate synthase-1/2/3 large subunit